MRIIAGVWRGRNLASPAGAATRPTAERLRESVFNMLMHAAWAERLLSGASVLDGFAGTGALGLEALSRGAASCVFVEQDRAALMALRANIIACRADSQARVLAQDALKLGRGAPCHLVFLDPPYGADLVPRAVSRLAEQGWITAQTVIVAETGRDEPLGLDVTLLAERSQGAGRVSIWRQGDAAAS